MLTHDREIVDESDVYVDVHKAIRRLTPAPRAKKNQNEAATAATAAAIAAKKPSAGGDGSLLVDIAEHPDGRAVTVGSLGAQSDTGGTEDRHTKTAIFMKRRSSAGPDGKPESGTVPVKASLNEMRQQLRLGPANRAAKPRNTRTNVFKIKQGLGVTTLIGTSGNGKLAEVPTVAKADDTTEQTPLLVRDPMANGGRLEVRYGSDAAKQAKAASDDDDDGH